jgi:hypothetical protein
MNANTKYYHCGNKAATEQGDYVVLYTDTIEGCHHYGDVCTMTDGAAAVDVNDIVEELRNLLDDACEDDYVEALDNGEMDPKDIVTSAGLWDDCRFVRIFCDLMPSVSGVRTQDGLVILDVTAFDYVVTETDDENIW